MSNFSPPPNDLKSYIKLSQKNRKKILARLMLTVPGNKEALKLVEEMAIERTMEYMWNKGYWVLREQQHRGPADLYAYKIINARRVEYFIDAKGIHPKAKQSPRFKPQKSKFPLRDKIINRIVSIVHNGKIKFIEGYHTNYKNLKKKGIQIIE